PLSSPSRTSDANFSPFIAQRIDPPIPTPPLPEETLPILPPPEELLAPSQQQGIPDEELPETPATFFVERFEVVGSTVFKPEELIEITAPFAGSELTFAEVLQVRADITQLYIDRGYISSGAIIPPQNIADGTVVIQVVEGSLEEIQVNGTRRLNPSYIRSRLDLAGSAPLNVNRLLEGLQLLGIDPLIENISAELQTGNRPETRLLVVEVSEAKSFYVTPVFDNSRVPSVGSFRRQIQFDQGNLLGFGDRLLAVYTNTDGSNVVDFNYTFPINPRNGTLRAGVGFGRSHVIEDPFDILDISSDSNYYELSYRQPIILKPTEELALGLTFSWQDSQTELGLDDIGPFPLSAGADSQGSTRIAALRFIQEWTQRSAIHVLALRSQFSLGLEDFFGSSSTLEPPDSDFFVWRGQGQWVRLLAPDFSLILRGDVQLADRPLVPLEQVGVGGATTVRGYRQEALLTDSAALFSAEVRLPLLRASDVNGILHLAPFIDFGTAWNNNGENPDPNTLVGTGLGLSWQMNNFSARVDWGIPLVSITSSGDSLQEDGIYFTIQTSF
ncbi:MAG: ShlB/FhaC/HecB family hemolysin secretion/activation protein, partial [Spirulina sp.]